MGSIKEKGKHESRFFREKLKIKQEKDQKMHLHSRPRQHPYWSAQWSVSSYALFILEICVFPTS